MRNSKLINHLCRFFETLDLFGQPILFTVNKETAFKTLYGGILSLVVFTFTFFYFVDLSLKVMKGQQPFLTTQTSYQPYPTSYQFSKRDFFFFIALTAQNGDIVPNELGNEVYVPIFQLKLQSHNIIHDIPISLVPCSLEQINSELQKTLPLDLINYTYCIDKKEYEQKISQIQLNGTISNPEFQYMAIYLFECKSIKPESACHKDPKKYTSAGYNVLVFPDQMIDDSNLEQPFQMTARQILNSHHVQNFKTITIKLQHVFIDTFTEFFYFGGSRQIDHKLAFYSLEQSSQAARNKTDPFLTYFIMLDNTQRSIRRRYGTFLDVLAKAAALFKFMSIFSMLLLRPLTEQKKKAIYKIYEDPQQEDKLTNILDLIYLANKINLITKQISQIETQPQNFSPYFESYDYQDQNEIEIYDKKQRRKKQLIENIAGQDHGQTFLS